MALAIVVVVVGYTNCGSFEVSGCPECANKNAMPDEGTENESSNESGSPNVYQNPVFQSFHTLSEELYDGSGTWGETRFGYKMLLRDSYWRADAYRAVSKMDSANRELYQQRLKQVMDYLLIAQEQGGTGVFGIPADPKNPEFGTQIQEVIDSCTACVVNGWIVELPAEIGNDSLYYDHGYALYTMSKGYGTFPESKYKDSIEDAADWIVAQDVTTLNINYVSALAKGLAAAFVATGNTAYLDFAVALHQDIVFPGQDADGEWSDGHNDKLEYHGFIVSGLIALKAAGNLDSTFEAALDDSLGRALSVMAARNLTEDPSHLQTWMGTNLKAWLELERLRPLTQAEEAAKQKCVEIIRDNLDSLTALTDFRLQKALYSNFVIGVVRFAD